MKATTKEALEGSLEDSKVNDDLKDMPDHVKRMNQANKTFAVVPIHSKEDTEPENLSDFDSMAIKIAIDLFEKEKKSPFVHLQWLVADIANEVAMGVAPIAKQVEFKIVSTKTNDRRRSRITQRKAFDISTYNSIATTPLFAKKAQEFASEWYTRCNSFIFCIFEPNSPKLINQKF